MFSLIVAVANLLSHLLSHTNPPSLAFLNHLLQSSTIAVLKWQFFKLYFTLKKPLVKGQKTKGFKIIFFAKLAIFKILNFGHHDWCSIVSFQWSAAFLSINFPPNEKWEALSVELQCWSAAFSSFTANCTFSSPTTRHQVY